MLLLVALHLAAACLAPFLVARLGRNAFFVLAAVPAGSFGALAVAASDLGNSGARHESTAWLTALDLDLTFWLDPLSATLALLVTGVGALVLVYCARYFRPEAGGIGRLAGSLLAFAGVMLGLVVADNTLLLYTFWELTTIFSYLLIGHSAHRKSSRRAAMQALIVTTAGGLAMLVGLIVLGEAGSYQLSELVADPPSGPAVSVALVLVLLGALSKSAIFPTHFWLPAAMAAPTPISAYLHAAAMVKAGIYLVARLAPAFADLPPWRPVVVVLGLATMLLGGWRALRQTDIKLLLAFGTVSQLGFLLVLVGWGTREAALAGVAMLVAHALFKATLFLVVGAVDQSTGTRDLTVLSGVGRRAPLLAGLAIAAAASMAGLAPFVGFVGKEAAYTAFLHPIGGHEAGSAVILLVLVLGSALTVAYSARFVWGAFARKPGVPDTPVARISPVLLGPPLVLVAASLVTGVLATDAFHGLVRYGDTFSTVTDDHFELTLWHGLGAALALSAVSLALGAAMFWRRDLVDRALTRFRGLGDADLAYRRFMRGVDRTAALLTGVTQRGSLSNYLATILIVLVAVPGSVLLTRGAWPAELRLWDTPLQLVVAVLVVACAITAARVRQRLTAVILVGATGYGVGVIFVLQGAPDLALTQFIVESLTLVVFVLVLRKLPKNIVDRHTTRQRLTRLLIAIPAGLLMAGMGAVALGVRSFPSVAEAFPAAAYQFGHGSNVVNVTLVDIRAWDTLGEISVLVVAATGIASLIFIRRRTDSIPTTGEAPTRRIDASAPSSIIAGESGGWLRSGPLANPDQRSLVLEFIARLTFHTMVVLSLYLLFAGHNVPGGGFTGGLVGGLALVVRYLAGGRYELGEAAPIAPGILLGLGLLMAGGTGAVGLALGADVLQTTMLEFALPVFGDVKLVTALFFDMGVYLVVLGLVLDILRSLGAELDRREGVQ